MLYMAVLRQKPDAFLDIWDETVLFEAGEWPDASKIIDRCAAEHQATVFLGPEPIHLDGGVLVIDRKYIGKGE